MSKNLYRKPRTVSQPLAKAPGRFERYKPSRAQLISGALIFSASILAFGLAGPVLTVFTSGTTISSTAVNANFSALDARIAALETSNAALTTKLASVSNVTVNGQPTMRFTGVNVQVVNGLGATYLHNGTGNLIVGYDEADGSGAAHCTVGANPTTFALVTDAATCAAVGGTWTTTGFKTGSHYVVTGAGNNYSDAGGLLGGYMNTSNSQFASVTGGVSNTASGFAASVSGGYLNTANGKNASVSGGTSNTASGWFASVSGGYQNTASGQNASVSGGWGCNAIWNNKWAIGVGPGNGILPILYLPGAVGGCSTTLWN